MTGNFVNGSTTRAILAIVYSDSGSDVFYTISPPSSEQEKLLATISGLPSGLYNVSVFVVVDDGLPFLRSATTPRSVTVITEGVRGKLIIMCVHVTTREIWYLVNQYAPNYASEFQ